MQENHRPYIGHIFKRAWTEDSGQKVDGIALIGGRGIAAHLTKPEAFALADRIVDAAEHLPDPAKVRQAQRSALATRPRLTAADGTEEQPLPTSPAESE
ncbi:hypothetical protein OF385_02600 [Glutamicibacter sp. JL.03c]|uniref:hypothetical protein n=1 Tax=Glutamicibacter sp. JL.03c TaxID=2984842 RepID=UPI0021F75072|nr:hypothetical protein [Glutamicibacter sp. JL.03c]UYQ78079.1 hypothetical protein OF385_02600 [Glutamicibacter sp. JL.03c]